MTQTPTTTAIPHPGDFSLCAHGQVTGGSCFACWPERIPAAVCYLPYVWGIYEAREERDAEADALADYVAERYSDAVTAREDVARMMESGDPWGWQSGRRPYWGRAG
jgi:hypothetical protein